MLKLSIQCQQQYQNTIKRHLQFYFNDLQLSQEINENTIFIKEISSLKDINELKTQQDYVFLIENGTYMFELLEYKPLCFLRKKNLEKDLENFIELLQYKNRNIDVMLEFKSSYQQIRINAENIEYIESYGHYLLIHTESATFKVREKISDVLLKVEKLKFRRVHKSYIINEKYIKSKSFHEIIMKSEVSIPIGKKYRV